MVASSSISLTVYAATNPSWTTTIETGSMVDTASYVIFKDGSTYFAKNGTTGGIDYSGTNASQVIQNAIDNGYHIYFRQANYSLTHILTISEPRHIEGELRQWHGNPNYPTPWQAGVNFYYVGSAPANINIGVLNITALADVIIENIAIQGNDKTVPFLQMCGIQISTSLPNSAGGHGLIIRQVEISYFRLGIGTMGAKGPVDSIFNTIKIENCTDAVQVSNTGNYFENLFCFNNDYHVTFMSTAYGTQGTTFSKCWFNTPAHFPIRFVDGATEIEAQFLNCWFEELGDELVAIDATTMTVRNLKFDGCHFHTCKTSGYFANLTQINNGLVEFQSCTFDGQDSSTISIYPAKYMAIENCWFKNDTDIYPYPGTSNTGSSEASNEDWILHGLIGTPTSVVPAVAESDKIYIVQIKAMNSTQFQISLFYESGGSFVIENTDKTINWIAEWKSAY